VKESVIIRFEGSSPNVQLRSRLFVLCDVFSLLVLQ